MKYFALLFAVAMLLSGCAMEPQKPTDPESVSSMPWNRPERGEGAFMGGMMNTR